MKPAVIVLNGVSSAGKTTLAKAIQTLAPEPVLRVSLDDFIAMLPDGLESGPDWFPVQRVFVSGKELPQIGTGANGERLLRAMRGFVAQLATDGLCVIVDDVCDAIAIADYRRRIDRHSLYIVKVTAPMEEIARRESMRGDRLIGTAREQASRLHDAIAYDCEVDTHASTPAECAQAIIARVWRGP